MESKVKQRSDGEDKMWSRFQMSFFQNDDNVIIDDEHAAAAAAAVAATTFAINSLKEGELVNLKKMREAPESSGPQNMRRATRPACVGDTRRVEINIIPIGGQSDEASPRPISPAARNQNQNGKTRADDWERSKIERIQKRYEKMKSRIAAWENEKKMEVKLNMEKKKKALGKKRETLMQHYQNKIARIDMIAQRARAQLEQRRREDEYEVTEKARKIRATGTVPVKCFCFNCYC